MSKWILKTLDKHNYICERLMCLFVLNTDFYTVMHKCLYFLYKELIDLRGSKRKEG